MALRRTGFKNKRKPFKRKVRPKKKVTDKNKALAEEYGVQMTYWRYKGRKGIYWNLISQYIRKRDLKNWGRCISCDGVFTKVSQVQAGHYAPAGNCGFRLLFDERNINAECPKCNNPKFSPGKLIQYRANLVKRYGEDWVKQLDSEYTHKEMMKEYSQGEYDIKIKELQDKIKELDEENNQEHTGDKG